VEASASYSKMMLPEVEIPAGANNQILGIADLLINESATEEQREEVTNSISGILDKLTNLDALYTASAGIQVTQLIYSRSYWIGVKTTKKTQELYSILKTKTEEDVIADVATGYYQAGSFILQLETVEKSIDNLKDMLRIAELGYKNDYVKESSVDRLQVTITNLEVAKETLQNGIDIQLNYLKALAGMPGDTLLIIDARTLADDFVSQEESFNIENVPSYQLMLKQDEIYNQQVKLSRAKFYPSLVAFGKFSYSSYNFSSKIDRMNNMNTFGLNLSVPLFSSGVNNAKLKQSQLKQAELREDILKASDLLAVNYSMLFLSIRQPAECLLLKDKTGSWL
jgi:outer membrane protein TolC